MTPPAAWLLVAAALSGAAYAALAAALAIRLAPTTSAGPFLYGGVVLFIASALAGVQSQIASARYRRERIEAELATAAEGRA